MFEWWNSIPIMQQLFYLLAIPSTVVLILQMILLLVGGGTDSDADADVGEVDDVSADSQSAYVSEAAHDVGLHVFTLRGIIAFLAVSGWVGVAAMDMGASATLAFFLAVIAGTGAMVLTAIIIRASFKLQQSGNIDIRNAIGKTGEVYVPVPEGGKGKVTLVLQERFVEMSAICPQRALKRGEQVKITAVTQSNTLVVEPLS